MSGRNSFQYLSASAVSRLSHVEREEYYQKLIEDTADSDCDEAEVLFDGDNEDEDYIPNELDDSDAELEQHEVEINEESDDDEFYESDNEDNATSSNSDSFFATKDGVNWYMQPPHLNRHRANNIFYQENNAEKSKKRSQRKKFLESLGEELCLPLVLERSKNPNIIGRFRIRTAMECILGKPFDRNGEDDDFEADPVPERDTTGRIKQKGKCYMCYMDKQRRNTRQICIKCKKPICAEHSMCQTKCENCYVGSSTSLPK